MTKKTTIDSVSALLEKASAQSLTESNPTRSSPVPDHLLRISNHGRNLVVDEELQEIVWVRSEGFIADCLRWEEEKKCTILDDSVIYSFVEGVATLGWPHKEIYINFYEDEDEAETILKFHGGVSGKVISRDQFVDLFIY